uniref:Bm14402 n=1 Tax=Brugia malayi TaxID=6279 RepID=A0A1I9G2I4_BRUMA|nr:Bm14402 [Brugia malayi]
MNFMKIENLSAGRNEIDWRKQFAINGTMQNIDLKDALQ